MDISQQNVDRPSTLLPTVLGTEDVANVSRTESRTRSGQEFRPVDSKILKREFNCLLKKLMKLAPGMVSAKNTINRLVPGLARIRALLTHRGADRKALRADLLPKWTSFLADFAERIGYTPSELASLIRKHREPRKVTRAAKSPNSKPILLSLLNWIEVFGDHLPLVLVDVLRNAETYMQGRRSFGEWKDIERNLLESHRRQMDTCRAEERDSETSHVLVPRSHLM